MSQTAVVTGAARGIGAAISGLLVEQGWRVIGIDRSWPDGEPEAGLTLDLGDTAAIAGALSRIDELDGLVNNAAVNDAGPLTDTTLATWARIHNVSLTAAFELMRITAPLLAMREGAIVNVSSVHAIASSPGNAAYAAAKAGLVGLTRAAAIELGPQGVRVNAVLPGAVDSGMLLADVEGRERDAGIVKLAARTPLGRVATPSDIAEAVAFLLDGRRASFITGQTLVVDGGATAHLSIE